MTGAQADTDSRRASWQLDNSSSNHKHEPGNNTLIIIIIVLHQATSSTGKRTFIQVKESF